MRCAENTKEKKEQKEKDTSENKSGKKEGKGCTSKESGEVLNFSRLPVGLIGGSGLVPCSGSLVSSGRGGVSSSCRCSWISRRGSGIACCGGVPRSRLVSRSGCLVYRCGGCCWISCGCDLKGSSCSLVSICGRVSCGRCLISSCGCLVACGGRGVSCGSLVSCGGLVILSASLITGTCRLVSGSRCRIGCGLCLVSTSCRCLIASGRSLVSIPLSILLLSVSLLDRRWWRLGWERWLLASIVSGSVCVSVSSGGVALVHRGGVGVARGRIGVSIVKSSVMLTTTSSITAKPTATIATTAAGVLRSLVRCRLLICGISIARATILVCVAGGRSIPILLLESASCGLLCGLSSISVLELWVWLLAKVLSDSRSSRLSISRSGWSCRLAVWSIVDASATIGLSVLLVGCSR